MLNYKLCRLVSNHSVCTSYMLAFLREDIAEEGTAVSLSDVQDWWIDAVTNISKTEDEVKSSPHFYPNATQIKWTAEDLKQIEERTKELKEFFGAKDE